MRSSSGPKPTTPETGCCPSCLSRELRFLFETSAPIHTSKLIASREDALAYPCGNIRLEVCERCGLITNTAFDASSHDYSASYEETQAFSPRFVEFANGLARMLDERKTLRGREVLEIGCGRGDFLQILCDVTGCHGVGVDPSFREGERAGANSDYVAVRRRFFAEQDVDRPFALIVCRHTLEHVHDVAGFLGNVSRGLASSAPKASVFFEVPDTLRILREVAFWDIFYEHCTYFTPGSLCRAFRNAGFRPSELAFGFDDQYLLLFAERGSGGEVLSVEEPSEVVSDLATQFVTALDATRKRWTDLLRETRSRGETSVMWGAGSKGVGFLSTLGLRDEIAAVVDVNPAKHGMFMLGSGHEIIPPEALVDLRPNRVLVMNPVYLDEIRAQIAGLGIVANIEAI